MRSNSSNHIVVPHPTERQFYGHGIPGIAPEPDAVFYLKVPPEELVQRTFAKNASLDYWESGMDIGLSRDLFDSFMKYQTAMEKTFRHLQRLYGFTIVDGMRSTDAINS